MWYTENVKKLYEIKTIYPVKIFYNQKMNIFMDKDKN